MKKGTIFAIDDDKNILDFYRKLLTLEESYELKTFTNPLEAINSAQEDPPEVFLLDMLMPEMTGIEVMHQLNDKKIKNPVIVVSGHTDREIAIQIINQGAYSFLEKPFDDLELEIMIKRAMSHINSISLSRKIAKAQKLLLATVVDAKTNQTSKIRKLENKVFSLTGKVAMNVGEKKEYLDYAQEDRYINNTIRELENSILEYEKEIKAIKI